MSLLRCTRNPLASTSLIRLFFEAGCNYLCVFKENVSTDVSRAVPLVLYNCSHFSCFLPLKNLRLSVFWYTNDNRVKTLLSYFPFFCSKKPKRFNEQRSSLKRYFLDLLLYFQWNIDFLLLSVQVHLMMKHKMRTRKLGRRVDS